MPKQKQDLVRQEGRTYYIARSGLIAYLRAVAADDERELGETATPVECLELTALTAEEAGKLADKLESA